MNVKETVLDRYSEGARQQQPSLCCPVSYDAGLLAILPDEIIEKDYGCGDPSRYVQEGDVVLDLGSGGGKVCYMAASLVGNQGQVIGVDMNDDMLALARKYQPEMAEKLGGDRVRFVKGHIQDLGLSIDALSDYLTSHPINSHSGYSELKLWEARQRKENPLVQDQSVDLVISNCVLNLVADDEKQQLVREIYRVLKPGGRVAISDIVSDQPIPGHMKKDPDLWSGCISGAFQEDEFLDEFSAAGFGAVCYDKWDTEPWQVIEGIEFRAVTLTAVKSPCSNQLPVGKTLVYRGPFAAVTDEDGTTYKRGQRIPVAGHTYQLLMNPAFKDAFIDPAAAADSSANNGCCDDTSAAIPVVSSGSCC
ncbi:methyltransferase domain-containing protein [Gammaproteobacteria bacterium]|nr:methyltransferase domain-containing protein [Gammaproteobacteria bacterium]